MTSLVAPLADYESLSAEAEKPVPAKLAIISHILPPSPSGQAMVLYRILRGLSPEDYCLISGQDYGAYTSFQNTTFRLPARCYYISPAWQLQMPNLPGIRTVGMLAKAAVDFVQRPTAIARIVQREKCRAIVACTGSLFDLPSAYLASRWAGVPFYAYVFDDYAYQWIRRTFRFFAERVAPIVLRGATKVIVPNESLRDEYRQRYGIEPVVIHNPCESVEPDVRMPWPAEPGEIKIVYTGAVYGAHYDAFHNLLAAMELLGCPELKLHVYTAQPPALLEREKISGPVVYHPHLPLSKALEVQRRADILFLPLAFSSPYPDVIVRTSAPGKMGEYLATGRPVLAHAPGDSFVSWYFRKYEVGKVVDRSDPAAVAQAIQQIIDESDLRRKWSENALIRARTDFSVAAAQSRFLELFQNVRST